MPSAWGTDGLDDPDVRVELYLKDETTHITGSLKHRLARSLFLYALCNGWIDEGTTVVEASSGSTAISEAYFASLLGLPFIAVVPSTTSPSKVALIESQGGRCHFVQNSSQVYAEAERVARQTGGHYLDQFTNAERATDWRGNNNIAESIYTQMHDEKHPSRTGSWSARAPIRRIPRSFPPTPKAETTLSCPLRHASRASADRGLSRRFCPAWSTAWSRCLMPRRSLRPATSAPHWGRRMGPSTGTNLWGAFGLLAEMVAEGRSGSVVTLLADSGYRYADTYFDDEWVRAQGIDPTGPAEALVEFERSCVWN